MMVKIIDTNINNSNNIQIIDNNGNNSNKI